MRIPALLVAAALVAGAQQNDANYDEAKVPKYTLPDPLTLQNNRPVRDAKTWFEKRRPELLNLFRTEMYGRSPGKPAHMSFELTSIDKQALGGKAVRKEVTVYFTGKKDGPQMNILIYLPAGATKPVPLFLGLNFGPNQTVIADPGIKLRDAWVRGPSARVLVKKVSGEESRGQPLGGRADSGARIRAGRDLLLRNRARFRRRHAIRRARHVSGAGGRWLGRDRSLGVGIQPGARLPGDR
jgi:hypothetical protein